MNINTKQQKQILVMMCMRNTTIHEIYAKLTIIKGENHEQEN